MYEIAHKEKAMEITPDGIAAAAATLAVKSEEGEDLFEAFWYFFDALLRDQHQVKKYLDEKETAGEKLLESVEWGGSALGTRARNALRRGADGKKPITELTDDDLLNMRCIGLKTLAFIRTIIPAPLPEGVK